VNNPVARGFLDAQESLHKIQDSIQQYVSKTLELGRVPHRKTWILVRAGTAAGVIMINAV